ncbi:hypothetical protein BH11ARM2_BH11ARM2_38570 [soil metagenome]
MNERIEFAKNDFLRAKGGLLRALSTTPDDRLNWSPSSTARTPLQLAVHAADAIGLLHDSLDGKVYNGPGPEEADRGFREHERTFTDRDEALSFLECRSDGFLGWLDALDPEKLSSMVDMPFIGTVPVEIAITFPAFHTRWHHAQIDYVQTSYGDLDWHL